MRAVHKRGLLNVTLDTWLGEGRFSTGANFQGTHNKYCLKRQSEKAAGFDRLSVPDPANKTPVSDYSSTIPPLFPHYSVTPWSQLSDSAFLDRVNSAKIPLFYGLVKHFSRTLPNPSSTPNLLAISLAIAFDKASSH